MPVIKLTKTAVDGLKIGDTLWDTEVRGFGARRRAKGVAFVLKVTIHSRQRYITIGQKGAPWTVDSARKQAVLLHGMIAAGKDPAAERDDEASAISVNALARGFMLRHVGSKRKPSTASYYQQVLSVHILPRLGDRRAVDVTPTEMAVVHDQIRDKRPHHRTDLNSTNPPIMVGGTYVANRVLAIVSSMYSWGTRAGLLPQGVNPVAKVERYAEKPRERFLTSDEIERLGTTLRTAESVGLERCTGTTPSKHAPRTNIIISGYVTAALRLLMLTGCRLREVLHLEWCYVDLERGVLFLPDSKSGRKTIVLSTAAITLINSIDRVGRYVIASEGAGTKNEQPRSDLKRPWAQITKHAGLTGLRIHDLRHTYASIGAGANLGLPIIGKLLGHTRMATTERYAHLSTDPLRRSADMIADQIASAMNGVCK